MTTPRIDVPATPVSSPVTMAWLLRRSALWMTYLVMGVAAACTLYALASDTSVPTAEAASSTVIATDAR